MTRQPDRVWALWCDWCAAFEHDARDLAPAALHRFATHVPGVNLDLLHRAARKRGVEPRLRLDPWEGVEENWVSLSQSLGRCPTSGWPHAVPGRRDAWLVVLTRHLRMSRLNAARQRGRNVLRIVEALPTDHVDDVCLRCVVKRWVEVVATQSLWSRASVRELVWPRSGLAFGTAARPCDGGCGDIERLMDQVPAHAIMAPAIDRHGWWADWRPMSARAVTNVLAARCQPLGEEPALDETLCDPVTAEQQASDHEFTDETFDRLDAAMARADEVNARLEALLREHGG